MKGLKARVCRRRHRRLQRPRRCHRRRQLVRSRHRHLDRGRPCLDGAAGPGFNYHGMAPRGRPSTGRTAQQGRPCRSGRRDGAAYLARNAARERQYLVKPLCNEC